MQTLIEIESQEFTARRARPLSLQLHRAGLAVAMLLAGCHIFWAALILSGWAQPVMDFVFWAHMIQPVYHIKPFDPKAALVLISITFITGYVLGLTGAFLWRKLHHRL